MRTLSRLGAAFAAVAVATIAAVAVSSPASARVSMDGTLECVSGGYYHYTCTIQESPVHGEVWKYNDSHVPAFDGMNSVYGACAPNLHFSIGVTYTRANGTVNNTGVTLNCLQFWQ